VEVASGRDAAEQVPLAGCSVGFKYLGQSGEHGYHVVELALGEVELDEGLYGEAETGRADRRSVPGDDALALKPGEPGLHGAPGDAEHARVLAHAGLWLLEQEVQQLKI
jgi:hypothetical protein